jgi:putative ABC transport system permease protein
VSPLRAALAGLRRLFRKDVVAQELDDELRHYLEMAAQEKMRDGMSRAAAERAVRLEMGGVEQTKERVRAGGWEASVDSLWQDLTYALRGLRRSPAFTAITIATLMLGIGANTAMFTVVNAVMLRPLPYHDYRRLALVWVDDTRRGLHQEPTTFSTVMDWKRESHALQGLAYFNTQRTTLSPDDRLGRERTRIGYASGDLFGVLGVPPLLGRTITAQDENNVSRVAVISYSLWQRRFAGDSGVVGRRVATELLDKGDDGSFEIAGVMPAGFYFPDKATDLWIPATTYWRFRRESGERFQPWAHRWNVVARLEPTASFDDARADLTRIGQRLAATYTTSVPDFPGFTPTVMPIRDSVAGRSVQSALWILLGAVGLVLLVACANVANLLFARGAARHQEFAVRLALGAGRGRLVRQLLTESLVLALIGGAAGSIIAVWATRALGAAAALRLPRVDEITVDARVLAFAALVSVLAGLAFGIVPAFRVSATNAGEALKEGGHGTGSVRLRRSRAVLVVAECSLAVVLLAGAGLLLRSLSRLQAVNPGFDPSGVLTMRIEFPPESRAPIGQQVSEVARVEARMQLESELLMRIHSLPGVSSAGFVDDMYINGQGNESITIPGRAVDSLGAGELNQGLASPELFSLLRVPLRSGRGLTRDDATQKIRALWTPVVNSASLADKERLAVPEPVVVNEAFVRRFFPSENPIGKRFCTDPTNKTYWYIIVGVVGDMHRQGLEHQTIPEYFGPHLPFPNARADLMVRVNGDPLAAAPMVRREVTSVFPGTLIVQASTADSGLGDFSANRRLETWLLAAFAALALALAAVGIYGVVHYAVAERTREIGVRVALGATSADIVSLVMGDGLLMPVTGIAIGIALSLWLTRIMTHLLFEVGAADPATFVAVGGVLAAVAIMASYIPARRATMVDPVRALRQE